ncbi:MAG TPA: FKBP-type peptidyl-prolyl cis-trans isomerase [bacterium]|nr:FKBP-type peptidyl-prolyl cis-trans isomerase [bacterium]
MKSTLRLAVLATLALCAAACVRLNTPEKISGYAVGQNLGKNLEKIKDKVDLGQLQQGMEDQVSGTATMSDGDMSAILAQLQQGQSADPAKTGYAVGEKIGGNIKSILEFTDLSMIERGIKDEFAGKSKLSDAEISQALQDMNTRRQTVLSARNKADGDAFLAKNKALPGVMVTASGLQYQILRPGHGRKPKATDIVKVDYVGTLTDGTKFDSSYDRHQPATFPLNRVIPGWTEGLQLMKVGSKFRFVIPSAIGYGERGAGGQIGPDAVLVFEVELLGIQKGQ